ncbi:iron(III) transport system permease protein [Azospirillum agricola]|uniref:ABC transporter permease n=1 Tax=Azospirillum agricola TaxID=1720247 RepID=UPI001AE3074F|nr:iron ABC transporter permease [Azospirillum agricola]MBP2226970.1 iron(III) transport system permease protein [Azospirillum agricola]
MAMATDAKSPGSPSLSPRRLLSRIGPTGFLAFLLAILIAVPILAVFAQSFTSTGDLWSHMARTVLPDYIANTLILLGIVGSATLVTGTACAWTVTMHDFRGRTLLQWLLLLPLAMPAYVMAYTYTDFLQFAGPVQSWLRATFGWRRGDYWFPEIRSAWGAGLVLASVLYPYVYVLARAAFLEQSVCVLEAGRTLGCSAFGAFRRVALPLARPALVAGVGYALMETLADFGAVSYFGIDTFTVGIYRTWFAVHSPTMAAQLAAVLLLFVLALVGLERLSRGRMRFHQTTSRYRALPAPRLSRRGTAAAWAVCLTPVFFGFLLPGAVLIRMVLRGETELTMARFTDLVANTVILGASGAALVVGTALLVIHGVRHDRSRLALGAVRLASLGYATPGTVIAVGILLAVGLLHDWAGWSVGTLLGSTIVGILYGYLIRFFVVAYGPLESGFAKIGPNLEGAARSLGHSPFQVLRRVHLPLLRPSLLSAAMLVFVDICKELPATMILRPFNFDTLAIEAFRMASTERLDDAALPALVIVLVGLAPVIYLSRTIAASRPGHGG